MKKARTTVVIVSLVIIGAGILLAAQHIAGDFLRSKAQANQIDCRQQGTHHTVALRNDMAEPLHTKAKRCDRLTITNYDDKVRGVAFGIHDKHVAYDGVTQRNLAKGQSLTITLNQTGSYLFHDHNQETVGGEFSVE